jgi:hypothetical protein
MKGHIYGSYWLGFAIGFAVGVLVGSGIRSLPGSGQLQLPPITMGDPGAVSVAWVMEDGK